LITMGYTVGDAVVNLMMVLYALHVKNMIMKGCKLKHCNLKAWYNIFVSLRI
jgi:hypothetical protein